MKPYERDLMQVMKEIKTKADLSIPLYSKIIKAFELVVNDDQISLELIKINYL
jgi:hypothetical protein